MKRSDAFKGNYLAQGDVHHPFVATIDTVTIETLGQGQEAEQKPVLHFNGGSKPMVLNFFNWSVLEAAYGEESDHWHGKPVEVFVDPSVMFGSKRVGGLRLRLPSNSQSNGQSNGSNGHTNGHAVPSFMNLNMALTALQGAGLTKDDLKRVITSKGFTGYMPDRDTPTVLAMIEEAKGNTGKEQSFDDAPQNEEIPF